MEMFRFVHIEYLYTLIILPVLIVLFWLTRRSRRKALERFAQEETLNVLMPNVSRSRPVIKFIIWLFVVASVILAIARPQFGSKLKTIKRQGVELIIALDVSNFIVIQVVDQTGNSSFCPFQTVWLNVFSKH